MGCLTSQGVEFVSEKLEGKWSISAKCEIYKEWKVQRKLKLNLQRKEIATTTTTTTTTTAILCVVVVVVLLVQLGVACGRYAVCDDVNAVCLNGVCQCARGFMPSTVDNTCCKALTM